MDNRSHELLKLEGDGVAAGLLYQDYRHVSLTLIHCLCKHPFYLQTFHVASHVTALQGPSLSYK